MHLFSIRSILFLLSCFQLHTCRAITASESSNELHVAIFGFGGRAQDILTECLQLHKETGVSIYVDAICDDHVTESFDFYIKNRLPKELTSEYSQIFESKQIYPDTKEGVSSLLANHPNVDKIFITSPNNRHAAHLHAVLDQSTCKEIYLEKPLFRTIEEFSQFNHNLGDRNIQVGLTLRSAKITRLVAEYLKKYKSSLGKLKKVHSWEHVNFGHGLSIIMMNWRRSISQSGGFLIEKSVHDLDLACFFMGSVDIHPKSISIQTDTGHNFYKKSNKNLITNTLLSDTDVRKCAEQWDKVPWQRAINFSYDSYNRINWKSTMNHFFEEFPNDDDFYESDIIPDTHMVHTVIQTTDGDSIEFDLDLKLNGFSIHTERGCRLSFENGEVEVDMESSKMHVRINADPVIEIDLKTRGIPHAGGDMHVARGILGTSHDGNSTAQFSDPSVQISSVIGLISEYQALYNIKKPLHIEMINSLWEFELDPRISNR